jgi:hypothetical protein
MDCIMCQDSGKSLSRMICVILTVTRKRLNIYLDAFLQTA